MWKRTLWSVAVILITSSGAVMAELPDLGSLWNFSDPAGSEARFRELLADPALADEKDFLREARTQIARTLGLQRRFDEAHALLDSLEAELPESSRRVMMRYHLERGRTLNSSGNPEASKEHFLAAYEIGLTAREDNLTVDAAHMMGIVEKGENSLEWNEKAISRARRSEDPAGRNWLGALLNNTGWTYHDMGRYEKSLALFSDALDFREKQGNPLNIRIAKWCIARNYRSLGWNQEALADQRKLLAELEEAGEEDGYVQEEIAECLLALCRTAQARPHFLEAHALLSKDPWMAANESERLERLKRIGEGAKQ